MLFENEETRHKVFRNNQDISIQEAVKMGLEIRIETKKMSLSSQLANDSLVNVMLSLKSSPPQNNVNLTEEPECRGISYLIMLDRSESMKYHSKMENVKNSVIELIKNMTEYDRFCLIPFGGSNKVLVPFTGINTENRNEIINKVQSVVCEGRTDIVSVIQTAVNTISSEQFAQERERENYEFRTIRFNRKNKASKNINVDNLEVFGSSSPRSEVSTVKRPVNREYCVILLSDGEDNIHSHHALPKIREFLKNKNINYTLNSFGFGLEHDGSLLSGIAYLTGGQYYYIKEEESIYEYLKECQGQCKDIQFQNIEINIMASESLNLNNSSNQSIKLQLTDMPSNAIPVIENEQYKIHYQKLQNNAEKKLIFSVKIKKVTEHYESLNTSFSSAPSLSPNDSPRQRSSSDINLKDIESLLLGSVKVSFCRNGDDKTYQNLEIPYSININDSQASSYNNRVLEEITTRQFCNTLQKSIIYFLKGEIISTSKQLGYMESLLSQYSRFELKSFLKLSNLLKFFKFHLGNQVFRDNNIHSRKLRLLTEEIVFFFKYNQQQSLKIAHKIDEAIEKMENYFVNDITYIQINTERIKN